MSSDLDLAALRDIPSPADELPALRPLPAQLPPSPTRSAVRTRRAVAIAIAVGAAFAMALAMGPRGDLEHALHEGLLPTVALSLLAAVAGWVVAVRRPTTATPSWAPWLLAPFALFAAAGFLHTGAGAPESMLRATLACLVASLAIAAVPLTLLVVAYRHAFATSARKRSLAIGIGAGALAAAAMELHCAVESPAHMVVGHGSALLLAGLLGLAATRLVRA